MKKFLILGSIAFFFLLFKFNVSFASADTYQDAVSGTSDIVSYWKLDGDYNDSIGTNDGTGDNTSFSSTTPNIGTNSVLFNGSDSIIVTTNDSSLDLTSGITIELWVKVLNLGKYNTLLWKGTNDGNPNLSSYGLQYNPDGSITAYFFGVLDDTYYKTSENIITDNDWHLLTATYDGTDNVSDNVKIYVDGSLISSFSKTSLLQTSTNNLYIGSLQAPTYYNNTDGYIDEVALFSRPLTQIEIQNHLDSIGEPPPTPPIITLENEDIERIYYISTSTIETIGGKEYTIINAEYKIPAILLIYVAIIVFSIFKTMEMFKLFKR